LTLEADVEVLPSSLTGAKVGYMPQAYALLGGFIYGGVGIGYLYSDGEFAKNPTYALRAGLDIPLSKIHLDVNANYRFSKWGGDFNTDLITVGAVARYQF
jgi:hypothetical protein